MFTLLDLCVSSLRRGHANLLCIVPILTDDPRRESMGELAKKCLLTLNSRSCEKPSVVTFCPQRPPGHCQARVLCPTYALRQDDDEVGCKGRGCRGKVEEKRCDTASNVSSMELAPSELVRQRYICCISFARGSRRGAAACSNEW